MQNNHKRLKSENAKLLEAAKINTLNNKEEKEQHHKLMEEQTSNIRVIYDLMLTVFDHWSISFH